MQRSQLFLCAVHDLKKALPHLRRTLTTCFDPAFCENKAFCSAFETCFKALTCFFREEYRRQDQFGVFGHLNRLESGFSREDFTIFLMQYFMLEPVLLRMFPDVLGQNRMTQRIKACISAFEKRGWLCQTMGQYFSPIEVELHTCVSSDEKQHILNCVMEHFLNGFNSLQADVRGVIYTPLEVVNYMCASVEEQLKEAYGRTLSSANVPILDPCMGTGVFLVNVIGRIDLASLPYKYENELFGIEIMLFPYYIATLNIEQAFFERTGYYRSFPGLRYADALLG